MARIKLSLKRPWIPYVIFVVALLLTTVTTFYVNHILQERDKLRFGSSVQETQDAIVNEMEIYTTLLRGAASFFTANGDATGSEFETYVNRLRLQKFYDGIQGIGYIQHLTNDQKSSFLESFNNDDTNTLAIKPDGEREEYNVIVYLEPKNSLNQAAIGLDIYNDPIRLDALQRARDTAKPVTSKSVILTKTTKTRQPCFFIFLPIYESTNVPATVAERRDKITGYVFSPFRSDIVFTKELNSPSLPSLTYKIYDGMTTDEKHLVYDSVDTNNKTALEYNPLFQTTRHLTIDGETWTIVYTNNPTFEQASQKNLPPFIFLGGVLVSFLFFTLSRSQYIAKNNAEIYAHQLQTSQQELQKAIGMRDNFISIASHELKTPVTSLKVYIEVLIRQLTQQGETKVTDYLTKMNRQTDKLTLLIHDLLDVSRLQGGRLTFRKEKFDVSKLVSEVVEGTQQIATNHRIIIKGKTQTKVWGDRERISQVLNNLLTNAIKYSPDAKEVIVRLAEKNNHTLISVQDFGIGISKEHQKKIFNRFYRVNDRDKQTYPGLGIGLYISNEIMKQHNGHITIKSRQDRGSTFTFALAHSPNLTNKSN